MRLQETAIVIGVVLVMSIIFLPSCTANKSHVLANLPDPSFDMPPEQRPTYTPPVYRPTAPVEPLPADVGGIPSSWYPKVRERDWSEIVIHHSASTKGSAAAFTNAHRARGWTTLGYDFVIGNGSGTPDGLIEVGPRWKQQQVGAHCKTKGAFYNKHGVGICLVGNFDQQYPSAKQMASLRKLVQFVSKRYGITSKHVFGHGEVPGTSTRCPGAHMPMDQVRTFAKG
jgi:hypothetical protein